MIKRILSYRKVILLYGLGILFLVVAGWYYLGLERPLETQRRVVGKAVAEGSSKVNYSEICPTPELAEIAKKNGYCR